MGGGHERQVGGEDHDGIRKGRVGSGRQGLDGGGQAGHGTTAGHPLEHDAYALRDSLARAHDERRAVDRRRRARARRAVGRPRRAAACASPCAVTRRP